MTENCQRCALWELRLLVAVRAAGYVSQHVRPFSLREVVLEHMAAAWAAHVSTHPEPGPFMRFFTAYCADIEREVARGDNTAARHRVWTNHALALRGETDRIQRLGCDEE